MELGLECRCYKGFGDPLSLILIFGLVGVFARRVEGSAPGTSCTNKYNSKP